MAAAPRSLGGWGNSQVFIVGCDGGCQRGRRALWEPVRVNLEGELEWDPV